MNQDRDRLTDEAMQIAHGMAQELQEFYDAAIEGGSHLPGVRQLLDDWDAVNQRLNGVPDPAEPPRSIAS